MMSFVTVPRPRVYVPVSWMLSRHGPFAAIFNMKWGVDGVSRKRNTSTEISDVCRSTLFVVNVCRLRVSTDAEIAVGKLTVSDGDDDVESLGDRIGIVEDGGAI